MHLFAVETFCPNKRNEHFCLDTILLQTIYNTEHKAEMKHASTCTVASCTSESDTTAMVRTLNFLLKPMLPDPKEVYTLYVHVYMRKSSLRKTVLSRDSEKRTETSW